MVVGVPVRVPVYVLKLIPGGVALIAKRLIAPPVELVVKPVATVFSSLDSEEEESVKIGSATRDGTYE
jgi:hypothetical protein